MSTPMLYEKFDHLSEMGGLDTAHVPDFITDNLNPRFGLRHYQIEAIKRFIFYMETYKLKALPVHLLYQMATGSGKTLLMAANMLYLYEKGYRYFIFFVNSTNIIEKTKRNFLDPASHKYLFHSPIRIHHRDVRVREIRNLQEGNADDINILFTTIQGLHAKLYTPQENMLTFEDFDNRKMVLLSDEAHHMNALTKKKLSKEETLETNTWEYTIQHIFHRNSDNILLEYTATAELQHAAVKEKYSDKVIFNYSLKQFREDRYSKDVKLLQSDLDLKERILQAVVISQYRKKVAEQNGIFVKPVVLIKSNKIAQSESVFDQFNDWMTNLTAADMKRMKQAHADSVVGRAFQFFNERGLSDAGLARELQQDFSDEKRLIVNNKAQSEDKQLIVNSLEDRSNPVRIIFAVNKLNEGWDVLNLFDIVRTDESRGSKATTVQEAQLIGRGARYFPFRVEEQQSEFQRKYDNDLDHDLRILEELHYHSINDSKYISELRGQLRESGILPKVKKEITVRLKPSFKESTLYQYGVLFVNRRQKVDRTSIQSFQDMGLTSFTYSVSLRTGMIKETDVFRDDEQTIPTEVHRQYVKMADIPSPIVRKALQKDPFYHFASLKHYFPNLRTLNQFITSPDYFATIEAEVAGDKHQLGELNRETMLYIVMDVATQLKRDIQKNAHEYEGTKTFYAKPLKQLSFEKTLHITETHGDREMGVPMSHAQNPDLQLNLADKEWYVYEENYGTSEEKHFLRMMNTIVDDVKEHFHYVYILRNEKLFQLYHFDDGQVFEPDFVLFAQKIEDEQIVSYQLFIEPKGEGFIEKDKWKETFLKSIARTGHTLLDNDQYRLIGMPFYNKQLTERQFRDTLYNVLK